ncbi:MAG: Calx-beta domain-containing protein, partial [Vicinamibacteria bacterium]
DNDGPAVTVGAGTVVEGDAGTTQMAFPLTLSAPSPEAVVFQYAPLPNSGNASAGVDYVEGTNTVTFPPGSVSQGAAVGVLGDLVDEPTERFMVDFSALGGGTVAAGSERVGATIVDDDGGPFELRELSHGASFRSDLAGGADFFLVASSPLTTWEVVVDEASGDLGDGDGPAVQRVGLDLQTVLQSSTPVGVGPARSLRLPSSGGLGNDVYVRVSSATCGTACGADDTYRIRAYETTLRAPRYNCTGGQASVLVLQNRGDAAVEATALGFGATGLEQGGQTLAVGPRATQVFPLCTALPDRSGSLIVLNDGAYDQLAGKIVALEPATGLAFDTPLEPRRR